VEGDRLINSFRWRETVGPYEERPGHYGDVWNYWTDDGFGFFEGLQLAEDLGALPIWVFNNGISHQESVPTELIGAYVLVSVLLSLHTFFYNCVLNNLGTQSSECIMQLGYTSAVCTFVGYLGWD
jgi:hypothetical protein